MNGNISLFANQLPIISHFFLYFSPTILNAQVKGDCCTFVLQASFQQKVQIWEQYTQYTHHFLSIFGKLV